MSTTVQFAANQANAQHSSGPITPEGKATSARNNLRHGFRSATVLLPGDDPAEYEDLLTELSEHFDPADLTETRLIREMADAEWRSPPCPRPPGVCPVPPHGNTLATESGPRPA